MFTQLSCIHIPVHVQNVICICITVYETLCIFYNSLICYLMWITQALASAPVHFLCSLKAHVKVSLTMEYMLHCTLEIRYNTQSPHNCTFVMQTKAMHIIS